ncbi:hypothetical protein HK100_009495, partial [Physocladia obscura]
MDTHTHPHRHVPLREVVVAVAEPRLLAAFTQGSTPTLRPVDPSPSLPESIANSQAKHKASAAIVATLCGNRSRLFVGAALSVTVNAKLIPFTVTSCLPVHSGVLAHDANLIVALVPSISSLPHHSLTQNTIPPPPTENDNDLEADLILDQLDSVLFSPLIWDPMLAKITPSIQLTAIALPTSPPSPLFFDDSFFDLESIVFLNQSALSKLGLRHGSFVSATSVPKNPENSSFQRFLRIY